MNIFVFLLKIVHRLHPRLIVILSHPHSNVYIPTPKPTIRVCCSWTSLVFYCRSMGVLCRRRLKTRTQGKFKQASSHIPEQPHTNSFVCFSVFIHPVSSGLVISSSTDGLTFMDSSSFTLCCALQGFCQRYTIDMVLISLILTLTCFWTSVRAKYWNRNQQVDLPQP